MGVEHNLLVLFAIAFAVASATILLYYLIRRPPLRMGVKVWLLMGLGPLPIGAAVLGNVVTYEYTKNRGFCGSCHVMDPYIADVGNAHSPTLAAIHSRNEWFGRESCYTCHADYGMFGTVTTKLSGMKHLWEYYRMNAYDQRHFRPHLYRPFASSTCMRCHARDQRGFRDNVNHAVHAGAMDRGDVGCVSAGCHGGAHPPAPPSPSPAASRPTVPERIAGGRAP